jgi:hypothetical protein
MIETSAAMAALIFLIVNLGASFFKSKNRLEAENSALRHQLIVLQRKVRGRFQFTNSDRLFFIQLYRWCPSVLKAMMILRPETAYYNEVRTHVSLGKGAPFTRSIERYGDIVAYPILGGLHHRYARI